jgi:CheY-like chemotaxis protein
MELCIRDNGIGIPPNMIRLVFEPFIQLPNSSSRSGSGLGIGLSLSKKLVELHKGKITAKSEGFRKGSEFTVRLPIPPLKQLAIPEVHKVSQAKTAVEAKEPVSANPLKVLVVDDNEAAAHGIEKLLKYKGYDVAVAYDGGGALRMVTSFKPRVVVLDIGLPDMDGYMVAKELRDNGSDAFIVALTGYGQEDDKAKAREFGFDRHLTKPVGIDNLEEAIKPALTALRRGTVVA